MKNLSTSHKNKILAIATLIFFWQMAAIFFPVKFLLPSPVEVLSKLINLIFTASFWKNILGSTTGIVAGIFIYIIAGIIASIIAYKSSFAKSLIDMICSLFKATPVVVFIVILLILFPKSFISSIIVFVVGFPIIYSCMITGLLTTDKKMLEMAQIFRFSPIKKLRYIYLTYIKNHLLSGLEISVSMAWKAGIAAEIIGKADDSIGSAIHSAKIFLMVEDIFAYAAVIITLAYISSIIIIYLAKILINLIGEYAK